MKKHGAKVPFGPTSDERRKNWYGAFHDLEGNDVWVINLDPRLEYRGGVDFARRKSSEARVGKRLRA